MKVLLLTLHFLFLPRIRKLSPIVSSISGMCCYSVNATNRELHLWSSTLLIFLMHCQNREQRPEELPI
uniref:Secreted protein n=1 Tax=Arundo donax TaxID=35708 RepID=A0A0A9GYI0_ARUDO